MNQFSLSSLANFSSAVPWGLWVAVYIWLVGISAGAFVLVMWGKIKDDLQIKKLTRLGLTLSISTLSAGLISILIDLGHIERFYKLFLSPNPTSAMAWMVWLYNAYFAILAVSLLRKRESPKPILLFGLLFGLAIIVVESLLFAMPPGKHWHSLVFPIHFLASSIVSGIAALIFATALFWTKDNKAEILRRLSRIAIAFITVNVIMEIIGMRAFNNAAHIKSWILLLGNFIAIILLLRYSVVTIAIGSFIELVSVLLSKYNSLITAQIIEPYKGFERAYIEPRLAFTYSPTAPEILIASGVAASAVIIFYILYRLFPLTREG